MAKLRLGSLQIRIETGRFNKPKLEEHQRTCQICAPDTSNSSQVENEIHFLFYCSGYEQARNTWLSKLKLPENFFNLKDCDKLDVVLNEGANVKLSAQFIIDAFDQRSKLLNLT